METPSTEKKKRRFKQVPYTQLSLKRCREDFGWTGDVVERWIPGAMIRRDFLHLADLIMIDPVKKETILVQSTSEKYRKEHLDKMLCNAYLPSIAGAVRILLLTWKPVFSETGNRVIRYEPRETWVDEIWKASLTKS